MGRRLNTHINYGLKSNIYTYQLPFRYHKADADLNLSRAEVEKQRVNSTIKSQQCDDSKNEYANQLQKTNDGQVNNNHTESNKSEL